MYFVWQVVLITRGNIAFKYWPCIESLDVPAPVAIVLCLTWESPSLGKTVFVLRRGPDGRRDVARSQGTSRVTTTYRAVPL